MSDTNDDWKKARAERWRALRDQQQPSDKQKQHHHQTQQQPQAQPAKAPKPLSSRNPPAKGALSTHVKVALAVVCIFIAIRLKDFSENSRLNKSDTVPDARRRPAHAHRSYILSKPDFVHIYSSRSHGVSERMRAAMHGPGHTMWGADFNMDKGGITRCATTQYAMTTYLCGTAIADTDRQLKGFSTSADVLKYIEGIDRTVQNPQGAECSQWPEVVLRFSVHEASDKEVGHTFVLHFLPEGGVQVYQSCIEAFTLHTYLKTHGPIDAAGFKKFMMNLQLLENATSWTEREDAAYEENFLVSLSKSSGKVAVGLRTLKKGQHIQVFVEPACLVVPWERPGGDTDATATSAAVLAGTAEAAASGSEEEDDGEYAYDDDDGVEQR